MVVSVDGAPVVSEDAFETALSTRGPGRAMKLGVRQDDGAVRVVTLQAQAPPPGLGIRILREDIGISLRRVSGALRISVVDADSPAARKGLRSGDLLLGVNGAPVKELDDADRILLRDHNRRTVLLEIGRGRFAYVLTFPLD
jgi:serine protease DegQ